MKTQFVFEKHNRSSGSAVAVDCSIRRVFRAHYLLLPLVFISLSAGCSLRSKESAEPLRPPQESKASTTSPRSSDSFTGAASYYHSSLQGRPTANGEKYNHNALTAAHRSLPFGTKLQVTNLENKKQVQVRINDRGPFVNGRVLDLSSAAARALDMKDDGVVQVRAEVLTDYAVDDIAENNPN